MSVPGRRFLIEEEEVLTQSREDHEGKMGGELLRSGNREISVFREVGLKMNLSHRAHIEYKGKNNMEMHSHQCLSACISG